MKLSEKIRYVRKEKKRLSKKKLHDKLVTIFGDQAISYKSLIRLEKGVGDGRLKSIHQIACGLDMDVKELLTGTEKERNKEKAFLADIIRLKTRPGRYTYNRKAYMEILSSEKVSFISTELSLLPEGKTTREETPPGTEIFFVVIKGSVTVHIYKESHILRTGDSICFQGHLPHHFENNGKRKARAIVTQNPKTF